ncbi:hypothetical protein TcWFU_004639 [Taenia crassiceps]|uniref:Uncharacterized protein n=1 Tax=Taenia crassiceps TaxID=6207 RepID=A0ABR4QKY7_9CEST
MEAIDQWGEGFPSPAPPLPSAIFPSCLLACLSACLPASLPSSRSAEDTQCVRRRFCVCEGVSLKPAPLRVETAVSACLLTAIGAIRNCENEKRMGNGVREVQTKWGFK